MILWPSNKEILYEPLLLWFLLPSAVKCATASLIFLTPNKNRIDIFSGIGPNTGTFFFFYHVATVFLGGDVQSPNVELNKRQAFIEVDQGSKCDTKSPKN